MGNYQMQYNTGNVYHGKSVTESAGNTLDKAKRIAKKRARELNRGVRIYKDMGLVTDKGNYLSSKRN